MFLRNDSHYCPYCYTLSTAAGQPSLSLQPERWTLCIYRAGKGCCWHLYTIPFSPTCLDILCEQSVHNLGEEDVAVVHGQQTLPPHCHNDAAPSITELCQSSRKLVGGASHSGLANTFRSVCAPWLDGLWASTIPLTLLQCWSTSTVLIRNTLPHPTRAFEGTREFSHRIHWLAHNTTWMFWGINLVFSKWNWVWVSGLPLLQGMFVFSHYLLGD